MRPRDPVNGLCAPSDDERGSTLILTMIYAALALAVVVVVAGATSLYLERKQLYTLADGAALVGAESFDLSDVVVTEQNIVPVLDQGILSDRVGEYLDAVPVRPNALQVEQATTLDGRSATVTLSSRWEPPILSFLIPDGIRIEVTSVARAVIG